MRNLIFSRVFIYLFLGAFTTVRAQSWHNVGDACFSTGEPMYTRIVVDKHGTPYVGYSDYSLGLKAVVMKYDGSSWVSVGTPGFSRADIGNTSLALDTAGTPYMAYCSGNGHGLAVVKKYADTGWVTVGVSGFSSDTISGISIAIGRNDTPYVVFDDENDPLAGEGFATVMKFDGSAWVTVGSPRFSLNAVFSPVITIDSGGTPYVVYMDGAHGAKATVMKFDGTRWDSVGHTAFSAHYVYYPDIATGRHGEPYVVYCDGDSDKAIVMTWNGSNWVQVGSSPSADGCTYPGIAIDSAGTPYVSFLNYNPRTFRGASVSVVKYDGNSWISAGSGLPQGSSGYTSVAVDKAGTPYVVFDDSSATCFYNARVMKLGAPSGLQSTGVRASPVSIYPNPNNGSFSVDLSGLAEQDAWIIITNVLGEKMLEDTVPARNNTPINLHIPPGFYFITTVTERQRQTTKMEVR